MIFGPKRFIHAYGHPAVASQQQVANGNAPALTGHEILAPSFAVGLSSRRATLFEQLDWKPSTKVISRLMAPRFDFCSNPESALGSAIAGGTFRAKSGRSRGRYSIPSPSPRASSVVVMSRPSAFSGLLARGLFWLPVFVLNDNIFRSW